MFSSKPPLLIPRRKFLRGLGAAAAAPFAFPRTANAAFWKGQAASSGGGGLPPGVTLQAIDGGPTYFADNGFTYAVNAGWDDPSFIQIATFVTPISNQTDANNWIGCGMNTASAVDQNNCSLSVMRANSLWCIPQFSGSPFNSSEFSTILANNGGSLGTESVGINTYDEPDEINVGQWPVQNCPNASQDARFLYQNHTWNQYVFGLGHTPNTNMAAYYSSLISTPNATQRHLHMTSVDIYWMAGDTGSGGQGDGSSYDSGVMYNTAGSALLTNDQRRRGARYGDQIDWIRKGDPFSGMAAWQTTYPAPVSVFIETGGPYTSDNTLATYIQPPELNAAVWSTIIHGARYVQYFPHTFGSAGGDNLVTGTFFKVPRGTATISMYDQVNNTNTLVKSLARVINSPFALGYANVSPFGWKFGDAGASASGTVKLTGFDIMSKYNNVSGGDNKFYVFCMPRYSPASLNQTATITIADTSKTTATVIGESRTVTISGGVFTDNFADGHTVHIYRIDP